METVKIYEIPSEATIITTALCAPEEMVCLFDSGKVIRYKIGESEGKYLFSVTKSVYTYEDGGFDLTAPISIYTLDDIVVVVNDYKRHGFVHYPGKYKKLHLWRKARFVNFYCYPICLFKDKTNTPYLIFGDAINHLQIMNLDTCQVVTAAKSLIKEFAEEKHIEFYKRIKEVQKVEKYPWPTEYDHIFGKLAMSPDKNTS